MKFPALYLPHAVGKAEGKVVLHFMDERHCVLVICLCLPTKPSNEVTRQGNICWNHKNSKPCRYMHSTAWHDTQNRKRQEFLSSTWNNTADLLINSITRWGEKDVRPSLLMKLLDKATSVKITRTANPVVMCIQQHDRTRRTGTDKSFWHWPEIITADLLMNRHDEMRGGGWEATPLLFLTPFLLKPFPFYFHINEHLTEDLPSSKTISLFFFFSLPEKGSSTVLQKWCTAYM